MPSSSANKSAASAAAAAVAPGVMEAQGDLHNYDDRYFLDHDKFRKERNDALNEQLSLSKKISASIGSGEEKKDDDAPTSKRPKI